MRDGLRAFRLVLGTALRADPRRAAAVLLLEPASALAQPLFGVWLKMLVDGALRHDGRLLTLGAAALAGSLALLWLVGGVGNRLRLTLAERVGFAFDLRIATLSANLPTIEHQERADYQDKLALLREQQGALGGSVHSVVQALRIAAPAVVTLLLLASVRPELALLPAFAIPSVYVTFATQRWLRRAEESAAPSRRLATHFYDLSRTAGPGKELRVLGLRDDMTARHRAAWLDAHRVRASAQWKSAAWAAAGWAVFAGGFAGAVVLVARDALAGRATPGDIVLTLTLARQVNASVAQTVSALSGLQQSLRAAGRLLWLVDYGRTARTGGLVPPALMTEGIAFESVSFRYPGTDRWVLRDVSLRISPGDVVALVGANGAGKTSMVKLLCRMYEPTEGRITLDGVDIRKLDVEAYRATLTACFQDFLRLELLAGEAVGVGDLPRSGNDAAVGTALTRAGATDVATRLPRGLDTQLGRAWPDGVDLSTGQWQKLALGRAFMRDEPLVVVLDEPTASLDPMAEHELFERFGDSARRTSAAVTLLVSHRFSTVRGADLIVVLEDGRIVEAGPHEDLVATSGQYRELYEIQAAAYR